MQGEIELSMADLAHMSREEFEGARRRIVQALEAGVITYAESVEDPVSGALRIRVGDGRALPALEQGEARDE